jgi:hypothetical protein
MHPDHPLSAPHPSDQVESSRVQAFTWRHIATSLCICFWLRAHQGNAVDPIGVLYAPGITVAVIDATFLDLKTFPVKQQEIQLKIDGDTDPNTLQRLRDQIVPSVQHHKQVINDFIGKTAVAVAKAKTKEDAEKLAKMKDAPKQVMECVGQAVQNQIDMITQLHDTIDEGKKVLQSAEDHIKNAESVSKPTPRQTGPGWR